MSFSSKIGNWFLQNKRDLPWRNTKNPYPIWLSEVMLQQTRVSQALPYYNKFIKRFPEICDLAAAEESEVLKLWQGLGYYSRGRNLHKAAKKICHELNGKFPTKFKELKKLPGVGEYTASAVASFAYQTPVAVVDGNVFRVVARFLGISTPINSTEGEKIFKEKAQLLLNKKQPDLHNQAIMEFGALHCTPKKPNCLFCPLQQECVAFQLNRVNELPVKIKKTKVKDLFIHYFIFENEAKDLLIQKRDFDGIWKNLYVFPSLEYTKKPTLEVVKQDFKSNFGWNAKIVRFDKKPKHHLLSHRKIQAYFWKVETPEKQFYSLKKKFNLQTTCLQTIKDYPVPVLIQNFIKAYISSS